MAERRKQRKILVAVDEGEESSYALRWCLHNVVVHDHDHHHSNNKDTLILLYAKPPPTFYPVVVGGSGYIFSSDIVTSMERYMKQVSESVIGKAKHLCNDFNSITVETIIESGDARDVICEVAENRNVDLVVLGSHGYGVFKRAFLGSVSNHCAQNLKCPVLIVKHPESDATK